MGMNTSIGLLAKKQKQKKIMIHMRGAQEIIVKSISVC